MHLNVSRQASDDAGGPARQLLVNNQVLDASTVQRSALLQDVLNLTEDCSCSLKIDFDAFCAWRDFDPLLHSGPDDLVRVLQAADFLQDSATLEHATSSLVSHLRTPLRTSLTTAGLLDLPALNPKLSSAVLRNVAEAMAPLKPSQLCSVLQRLHPFELSKLPDPLRCTAFARFSDDACPMDLTPPLCHINVSNSAPRFTPNSLECTKPLWETSCQSLLHLLSTHPPNRPPVASLLLSHISQQSATYLHRLFSTPTPPTSLQIFRPDQHCPLTFLHAATSLTRLHLGTDSALHTSLLDALTSLSQLQDLSLCLHYLPDAEPQRLRSPSLHSSRSSRSSPRTSHPLSQLVSALRNVRRARLIPHPNREQYKPEWPGLLCRALPPLTSLEEVTLAGRLDSYCTATLLGSTSRASPHRLTSLKVPCKISACGCKHTGDPQLIHSTFDMSKLCHALPRVHTLRELELDCYSRSCSHLSQLSQLSALEALRLDNVDESPFLVLEEGSFLASLVNLRSLALNLSKAWDSQAAVCQKICRDAVALPLTRLCLWGADVMKCDSLGEIAAMRALIARLRTGLL